MSQNPRTVLIVDDSPEDRELYGRYLLRDREHSYTLVSAKLGREGLELWQRHQPDAVLLDYRLPDLDGLEFLAQLQTRSHQPCLPVIVVTGYGNEAIAVQAMKAGAQDYLVKEQITPESLQLAVNGAIETVQLRTQLQQRIERERLVAQITRQIHQSLDLDEILQTTVTQVRHFLQTDRVLIFRLHSEGQGIVVKESVGTDWTALLSTTLYDPCFNEHYVEAFRQGLVTIKPDIYDGSIDPCHVELLRTLQVRANLVVPIVAGDQLWGMLIAHHCTAPRQWQSLEIDLLKELATQVGIALQQAELYQQVKSELAERQRAESALRQQTERERLVWQIAQRVRQTLDLNEILQTTVDQVRQFLVCDRVFIYRFGPDFSGFVMVESVGDDRLPILDAQVEDQYFMETRGEDYRTGRIQAIADIYTAGLTECHVDLLERFQVRANLAVPILQGEALWGLLVANQCSEPRQWQPLEIDLLKQLTNQVAIALQQADLYQQAQNELAERRRVEAELRESEERFQAFMNNSPFAAFIKDENRRLIYANPYVEQLFGKSAAELIGCNNFGMLPESLVAEIEDHDRTVLSTGEATEFIETIPNADGVLTYWLTIKFLLYNSQGQPLLGGISIDISDRKRAEEALRDSEERFRQIAENIDVVFWITELPERRVSYVSPAYARLWGLNPQCVYDDFQVWVNQLHPEDREPTERAFQEKAFEGRFDEEYRIILPDGSVRWVRDRCFPLKDESGKIYRLTGLAEDISDRKQAEEALRQSEEFKQRMLESSPDCIKLLDINGRLLYMNAGGLCLMEIDDLTPYLNTEWICFWQGEAQQDAEAAMAAAKAGGVGKFQGYCPTAKGTPKWWEVIVSPILDGLGQVERLLSISRDITDRKQAEEALRESEQRLQMALDGSGGGLWDWNIVTNEDYLSPRWLEMLGYEAGELPANYSTWEQLIHPDDKVWVMERLHAHLQDDSVPYKFEYRVLTKSGEWKWIANYGKVVMRDAQGNPLRMAGIHYDITDRKQAEVALRENEARLQLAQKATKSGLWDWDITINSAKVSEEYCTLFGLDPATEEVSYEEWLNLLHPDDRTQASEHVTHAIEQREDFEAEYRILHPDGIRWLYAKGQVFYDETGKAVRMLGNVQDISDRKRAQQVLQNALQKLNFHVENSPLAVIEWDSEFRVSRWSPEAERIFGWQADEVIGKRSYDWQFVFDQDLEAVRDVVTRLAGGMEQRNVSHNRNYTKDGAVVHCEWYNSTLLDASGRLVSVLSLVLNVSDRVRLLAERDRILQLEQTARAEAERANRIKDEFLAVLSHELRSPLNPILGWTRLLQTRKFDETKTAEALATIERNVKLQTQLIDDLLDVARILRGKLTLNAEPINLAFVIESAIETVRTAAVAKSILIHSVLPNIGQVSGESVRLQQIIWNLLSNAVKFTPRDGRVEIRLEQVGDQAEITVTDTGKGIKSDFLPHIFEYFRQEDASVTRKHGGLGLGLAIVRHLVEAHGGTVTADSPGEGQGATFTVRLPLLNVEPETDERNQSLESEGDLTGIRVLVVDDEPDTREILAFILKEYKAEAMAVASVSEVLTILESFNPDILISDIGMPDVDGYTLLRRVRSLPAERGGQIPAIALTAYARVEDQQQALVAGFQRHISKPVDPGKLVATISELLSRH
jgi:PAS domain S-box-containing protein